MASDSVFETTAGLTASANKPSAESPLVPALTIMAHPECGRIGDRFILANFARCKSTLLARGEPDFANLDGRRQQPLLDAFISRQPFCLSPAGKSGVSLDLASSRTRIVAGGSPVVTSRTFTLDALAQGVDLVLADRVVLLLHLVPLPPPRVDRAFGMVGGSAVMAALYSEIRTLSDLDVSVLLRGETGTGKELMARALHTNSPRKSREMVSVNLGAIPPDLAAAELFGAVRGAYTGAVPRAGFFRAAHRGTLFLDEIGEASLEVQTMLLRVLETGEIFPVGSQTPVRVDVRIVAATDVNLEAQASSGHFKSALLQRLTGYEIRLPPLRERPADIGRLFLHFARQVLQEIGEDIPASSTEAIAWIPAELMSRLCRLTWPGNVRQLRNIVRQLVISSRGKPQLVIGAQVDQALQRAGEEAANTTPTGWRKPHSVEREELEAALGANAWNLKATARQLQISRTSLYKLIQDTPGLHTAADLDAQEIETAWHHHNGNLTAMAAALKVSGRALRTRLNKLGLIPPT